MTNISDGNAQVNLFRGGGGALGILFRYSDPLNYWYAESDGNSVFITKRVNGVALGASLGAIGVIGNLRIVLNGSTIKIYMNNNFVATRTDNFNQNETGFGIFGDQIGSTSQFDNISVTSL